MDLNLKSATPFAQYQLVEVQFGAPYVDVDVPHQLMPPTPEHVFYTPVSGAQAGVVYHDLSGSRRAWRDGVLSLRCSVADARVKLLLWVGHDLPDLLEVGPPAVTPPAPVIPTTFDAAAIVSGVFDTARIPTITDGMLDTVAATRLTGTIDGARIPDPLPAVSGVNLTNLNLASVWPVGSIYISVTPTNPATLFGFGTWVAFGTGRTLIAIDAGQAEFDTVEETGGAKTVALTVADLPSHAHPGSTGATTLSPNPHSHLYDVINTQAGTGVARPRPELPGVGSQTYGTRDTSLAASTTVTVAAEGGGGAHANLPPYIVTYMWKRTV
jgi:microcystin-dependent protein